VCSSDLNRRGDGEGAGAPGRSQDLGERTLDGRACRPGRVGSGIRRIGEPVQPVVGHPLIHSGGTGDQVVNATNIADADLRDDLIRRIDQISIAVPVGRVGKAAPYGDRLKEMPPGAKRHGSAQQAKQ
jgi:hypothetical protein